jgi:hypothetical protein
MISLVLTPQHPKRSGRGVLVRLGWLILVGYLLFVHGCHVDEDTELFSSIQFTGEVSP